MLVLDAARQLGVEIESICGGRQTCEKCRVIVEEGNFDKLGITCSGDHCSPRTEVEIELLKELGTPEQRLSCNARILGDLLITVPEGSRAKKQIIRKSASERVIEVDPSIRQVYVEVDKAQLGMHRGDWGRLQDALAEQWNLKDLGIELQTLQQLQATLRKKDWKVTVTIWNEHQVIDVQPGYQEGAYGLAVDVGSTTVASYLCDLRTGELLATGSGTSRAAKIGTPRCCAAAIVVAAPPPSPMTTSAWARLSCALSGARNGPAGNTRPLPRPVRPSTTMIERSLASAGF